MSSEPQHRHRRSTPRPSFLFVIAFAVLMLSPVLSSVAQVLPIQAQPTATAEPTELPVRANPTQPPEPDPIDDLQANPTKAPETEIDGVTANPTRAPETVIDDRAIPESDVHSVTVIKRDCPVGVVEDAFLSDYLTICTQEHNGVDFSLSHAGGVEPGTTANGHVLWTNVAPGAFEIQESLPQGYKAPIVFCGFTESPGGGVQHPSLQASADGQVTGDLPDTAFEYVCYWMNIPSEPAADGPDDVQANPTKVPETEVDDFQANPTRPSTLTVRKWVCPPFYDPLVGSPPDDCAESLNGITFDLVNHAAGQPDLEATTGDVIDGAAYFEPQSGTYSLKEQIPDGYGQPFLWDCTGLDNIPDDLDPPLSTINFFRIVIGSNQVIECDWMNVPGGPDDVQANPTDAPETVIDDFQPNPGDGSADLTIRKWACPNGEPPDQEQSDYLDMCTEALDGIEFTLTTGDGASSNSTASGIVEWAGLQPGELTIQETIPVQYGEPVAFCGWWAIYDGAVYDAFPQLVPSGGGLVEAEITIPNTHYFCDWFNVAAGPGDVTTWNWPAPIGLDALSTAVLPGSISR